MLSSSSSSLSTPLLFPPSPLDHASLYSSSSIRIPFLYGNEWEDLVFPLLSPAFFFFWVREKKISLTPPPPSSRTDRPKKTVGRPLEASTPSPSFLPPKGLCGSWNWNDSCSLLDLWTNLFFPYITHNHPLDSTVLYAPLLSTLLPHLPDVSVSQRTGKVIDNGPDAVDGVSHRAEEPT